MAQAEHRCRVSGTDGECWLRRVDPDAEITPQIAWSLFRECLACDMLRDFITRADGRRTADRIIGRALGTLLDQLRSYDTQLQHTGDSLRRRVAELTLLHHVSSALARTSDIDKNIQLFLVGVTAGGAIGLNRALLLLVEEDHLLGKLGLGHLSAEEGRRTWMSLAESGAELEALISRIFDGTFTCDRELNDRLRRVRIPRHGGSAIAAVLDDRETHRIDPATSPLGDPFLQELYGNLPVVAVPLYLEQEEVGVLLADNFVTRMPILEDTITLLQTLANQAAVEIVNSRLHADLARQLQETEHLYELLRENQNYLLQHERLVDMGKLATTVAHEIKTPLVAIGGFARRAQRALSGHAHAPRHEIEIIIREVHRLERITTQILDYSKQVRLNLEQVDLRDTLEEALEMVEARMAQAHITVDRRYEEQPCEVMADARRMKQVILNLLENAIEAMSVNDTGSAPGGQLTLSVCNQEQSAIVELEDTGPGVPDEIRDHLFTPFFTTKAAGSGLGLPVSRRIVTDHGGQITFVSTGPRGTKIRIELPKWRVDNLSGGEVESHVKNTGG